MLTLLSDFGTQDAYVGVMKGVIAQINPTLSVVDLTHAIPPQDIAAGRFNLMNAFPYFPKGTVHVAVVDPGVGSHRRAIAIRCSNVGYIVAPDNGIISGVLAQFHQSDITIIDLINRDYWHTPTPSATFHGRDIFAPVGAHLASGIPIDHLGPSISVESLVQLPIPLAQPGNEGITGVIQYIDIFGNLVTNIPGSFVTSRDWSIQCTHTIISAGLTYDDAIHGQIIALVGSHGWVEIAVNQGNAAQTLQVKVGDSIELLQH